MILEREFSGSSTGSLTLDMIEIESGMKEISSIICKCQLLSINIIAPCTTHNQPLVFWRFLLPTLVRRRKNILALFGYLFLHYINNIITSFNVKSK